MVLAISIFLAIASVGVFQSLGYTARDHILTPALLGYWFQFVSALVVPGLWRVGWGAPWDGFNDGPSAVLHTGAFSVAALAAIWTAQRRPTTSWFDKPVPKLTRQVSVIGIGVAILGLGLLYATNPTLFNTAGDLVRSQGDGLTAGSGPIYALFAVSLWVALFAPRATRSEKAIIILAILAFSVTVFLTGQKSRFAIMVFVLFARGLVGQFAKFDSKQVKRAAVLFAVIVGVTTVFNVEVRSGGFQRPIAGIDPTTSIGYVEYSYARFAQSTFDMTRTVQATAEVQSDTALSFDVTPLWGAAVNPLPSALLDKPPPPSHLFSQEVFPINWAGGTGIPPSLAAELLWYFGLPIALLLYYLAFLFVSRVGHRWHRNTEVDSVIRFGSRILALFVWIILLKGGSDGAVRLGVTFGIALLILGALEVFSMQKTTNSLSQVQRSNAPPSVTSTHQPLTEEFSYGRD